MISNLISDQPVRFPPGRVLCTAHAHQEIPAEEMFTAIDRHIRGDFGEVPEEDRRQDECAVQCGGRIFSVYHSRSGRKFYVITEGDRSATTILLPEDY